MHRLERRIGSRLLALSLAVLLVFGLMSPMAATPAWAQTADPISILTHYKLVVGDAGGLRLGDPITRAEMAVLIVRVLGLQETARLAGNASLFKDTANHWARGEINVVSQRGIFKGYPDGTFGPKRNVTYAEMLTLMLRLVGKEPTSGRWPDNVLAEATRLGIAPPGLSLDLVHNVPAIRQHVFHSLGTTITTIPDSTGKTLIQKYVDSTPPTLTVAALPTTTENARITVQGTATGADQVLVNGKPVTLSNGSFQTTVDLAPGANPITVVAMDLAGNKAEHRATVTRHVEVTRIEISGPATVNAGSTAQYTVRAYDRNGVDVGASVLQARVEGNIGQFNLSTGQLVAGNVAATGRIVVYSGAVEDSIEVSVLGPASAASRLRVVPPNQGKPLELNESYSVTVEVVGAAGTRVDNDFNREIRLAASGLSGVTISPTSVRTANGTATFTIRGTIAGNAVLTPSSPGLTGEPLTVLFATPVRIKLTALPEVLEPDGFSVTTIRGTLVDAAGNPRVNDTGSDIVVKLSTTGSGATLIRNTLTIRRGYSSSVGYDGELQAGTTNKVQVTVNGSVTSSHKYSVEPVTVKIDSPTLADARKLQVISRSNQVKPGEEAVFTVQVLTEDDRLVRAGSVAFQIAITTDKDVPKENGIPEGMTVSLDNTGLNPVDDGYAETHANDTDDIIARTTDGTATIRITWNRSGTVKVTPVLKGATSKAYDDDGDEGSASSSTGLQAVGDEVLFAGDPVRVKLVALGQAAASGEHPAGSLRISQSSSLTLRAYVVDENDQVVPVGSRTITLTRVNTEPAVTKQNRTQCTVRNGSCDFVITGSSTVGVDKYQATSNGLSSSNILPVFVTNQAPPKLTINGVLGVDEVDGELIPRGTPVTPDHEYLLFDLSAPGTFQEAAAVYVYREGKSDPVFVSEVIDFSADPNPLVYVPRSKVSTGSGQKFYVVARNAIGAGPRSDSVTVDIAKALNVTISRAYYNASNRTLIIQGSGFSKDAIVDPARITLENEDTGESVDLGSGTVSISTGSITISFDEGDATALKLGDPTQLYAPVKLFAAEGWYMMSNGDMAPPETKGKPVTPMATIFSVVFDKANNKLTLKGAGFSGGSLDVSKLTITDGNQSVSLSGTSASRASDTEYVITVSDTTKRNTLKAMDGASMVLNADLGWFKDGSYQRGDLAGVPVVGRVTVTSASYDANTYKITLRGSGFSTDGIVDLTKIYFVDRSTGNRLPNPVFKGGATTAVPSSSTTIVLELDATWVQTVLDNYSRVYLRTEAGWYEDEQGLGAMELPGTGLLLIIP